MDLKRLKVEEEVEHVISNVETKIERFGKRLLLIFCTFGLAINIAGHFLLKSKHTVYTSNFTFDCPWKNELAFWIQISQIIFMLPNFLSVDCILLSHFIILKAHFKCCIIKIRELAEGNAIELKENLKKIIKYHSKIKK